MASRSRMCIYVCMCVHAFILYVCFKLETFQICSFEILSDTFPSDKLTDRKMLERALIRDCRSFSKFTYLFCSSFVARRKSLREFNFPLHIIFTYPLTHSIIHHELGNTIFCLRTRFFGNEILPADTYICMYVYSEC